MLIGLAAIVALFTVLWIVSVILENSSIVDMWWGPGILLIGITYLFTTDGHPARGRLVIALLALWAIRLAWHIGARNIGHGEDFRYTKWRRERGESWWGFGLFGVAAGGYAGLFGPAIMTFLLLRVSGVALLEVTLRASKPDYVEYLKTTSAFVPMPPRRVRP